MNIKTMNDIDALYEKPIQTTADGFVCPVCSKVYKTITGAEKHLKRQDCANLRALYSGTMSELTGYKIYKDIVSELNPRSQVTFSSFNKSKAYNSTMRYVSFVNYHGMSEYEIEYANWVLITKKLKTVNQVFSLCLKTHILNEFKVFLHRSDMIESEKYFNQHKDRMKEDQNFFVRSVEKCKMSIIYLAGNSEASSMIQSLEADYYARIADVVEMVLGEDKKK